MPEICSLFDRLHTVENLRRCALLVSLGRAPKTIFPIMKDPKNHEPTEEEWRTLARQASEEKDPEKLVALAEQIVDKYDEEKRRKLRSV